jgi:type II secretory pathway component GspD/PulD (secretin)
MPIISNREIETEVNIHDGETLVLGGMVRERVENYNEERRTKNEERT